MFHVEKAVAGSLAIAGATGLAMMANNFATTVQYASAAAAGALFFCAAKLIHSALFEREEELPSNGC